MTRVAIKLEDVTKHFGQMRAVDGVSLEINKNEVFGLLGPCGCGKTTILRLIAGLETPDGGDIMLDDRAVVSASNGRFVPPINATSAWCSSPMPSGRLVGFANAVSIGILRQRV